MKMVTISTDIAALGIIIGSAAKFLPAIAALFGAIWYAFVIYDRIRYGPELTHRELFLRRNKLETLEQEESDE